MNFVKKINKYLLEHYPLIWNTRLVWMLGVGVFTHLLFFIMGYFSVNNQIDLESEYRLSNFYFDSSAVFLNVLLSIIILLIWIVYYLQNNAFKNLYTLKKGTLFTQFCIIMIIIFINICQYYSFNKGLKLKIRNLFSWEEIDTDIKEFNKTAVFLINNKEAYKINNKAYPKPFPLRHSETNINNERNNNYTSSKNAVIDTTKAFFFYKDEYHQFYNVDIELMAQDSPDLAERTRGNNKYSHTLYKQGYRNENVNFKYRQVKNVFDYREDLNNCLVNYSGTLYRYGQDSLTRSKRLKYYEELFKRGDEQEIKENLQSFLNLAKKYKVEHNLNIEEWYGLLDENNYVYTKKLIEENESTKRYEVQKQEKKRKNYIIKQFILSNKPVHYDSRELKYRFTKKIEVENRLIEDSENQYHQNEINTSNIKRTKVYSKYKEVALSTQFAYCDLGNLDRFFSNTYKAYQEDNHDGAVLIFFFITSLIIGLLLFLFKVTDIRTLLLSFVAAAVVLIISGMLIGYSSFILPLSDGVVQYFIAMIIGLTIIIASLLAVKSKWTKLIAAILFTLALFTIPTLLGATLVFYYDSLSYDYRKTSAVAKWIYANGFWLVMFIWIISIGLYTNTIRKWKGLPE